MRGHVKRVVVGGAVGVLLATAVDAQQRPLVTEDPESVGAGLILIEAGVDYLREQTYPVSGLEGNLIRVPTLGLSIGISSIAEIQIDNLSYSRLRVTDRNPAPLGHLVTAAGDTTSGADDLVIGTKVQFVSETTRRPALGVRFATRLPNASNESGLGLDTMDFYAALLGGKTVQSVRIVGNLGVGILADPTRGDRQNDVLIYGVSVARAFAPGAEFVAEVNGRTDTRSGTPPPGTENASILRVGARYTHGTVRLDGGVLTGLTSRDPSFGVTGGLTWVFTAFRLP